MAFDFDHNLHISPYSTTTTLAWDVHNIGILNADMSMVMEASTATTTDTPFFSPHNSDSSTGYLQDALVEWSNHCKRRRLFSDENTQESQDILNDYCWDWNSNRDISENSNCLLEEICNTHSFADEQLNYSMSSGSEKEEEVFPETIAHEEAISGSEMHNYSSSSHSDTVKAKDAYESENQITRSSSEGNSALRKKLMKNKVMYPFAVVKPGGFEGDITLNDINQRMLMPPTRAVKHPVGDFACRPRLSPNGTGMSGKAVVAFTRLQTQGRGTITIIRTSG